VGDANAPSSAVFELLGGTHKFSRGLEINRKATLQGSGTIIGNVYNDRGTISPGDFGVLGQLIITGHLTNNGVLATNYFDLNHALQTNDTIIGISNLVYEGVLVVTNLSGTLAAGDSFKLFNALTYAGAFKSILPVSPGANLVWNTNSLTVNGILKVDPIFPVLAVQVQNKTNFVVTASNGVPFATNYILTSTNLATTNWVRLKTNTFDSLGQFKLTNTITTEPKRFYRLQEN